MIMTNLDDIDKPVIDLSMASSIKEWCQLYWKKYGKMPSNLEIRTALDAHVEWQDEYGYRHWRRIERGNGR